MAEEIVFQADPFVETCNRLYSKWKAAVATDEAWGQGCDAIVILAGASQEDVVSFPKSLALHAACFQLELNDVLFAFCEDKIIALAATKKAKLLQALGSKLPDTFKYKLEVLTRDKTDKDKVNFETVITNVKGDKSAVKLGVLSKEKPAGGFSEEWAKALAAAEGVTTADVTNGVSDVLVIKGKQQLSAAKGAGQLSALLFKKTLIEKILDIVDSEKSTKMMALSELIEKDFTNVAGKCEPKLETDDVQILLPPVLQSGGNFDLKWNAQTDESGVLHLPGKGIPAIHVAAITVHHKLCCSTVARTLMFNAKKDQIEAYKALFEVFEEVILEIKPGVAMRKIHETVSSKLKERDPKFVSSLFKELGWALGYEVRDKRYVLDEKNKTIFQPGMLVCLRIGLENLTTSSKDDKGKTYSLLIADTFIVTSDGVQCLTEAAARKPKRVQWNLGDNEDDGKKKDDKKTASKEDIAKRLQQEENRKKQDKMTDAEKKADREQWDQRNEEIGAKRLEDQKKRRNKSGDVDVAQTVKKQTTDYTETDDYPTKAFGHSKTYTQLCVDEKSNTLFVPINGVPVPFHVSCIRNANFQQQGLSGGVLRVNLNAPGGGGLSMGQFDKKLTFLREISYRAIDVANLQMVHKAIADMRKLYTVAEKERQATAEVEVQPDLKTNPNRGPRLQNVRIYPNLQARGRKTEGDLEAHLNGFRFTAKKDKNNASLPASTRVVDIIYKNIKHAFYQPSNRHSTLIILHLRLLAPIMINKAAHKDVQFYLEIEDGESLLDNRRRNQFDKDEIEDEEKQRKILSKLDKEFKNFCDKTHQQLPAKSRNEPEGDKIWDWDIPYNELMFQGSPKNQMVELFPSVNCIVHLATKPVFIAELDEIDMVYYERVTPGGGNFDLALVYKKFLNTNPAPKLADCWERIGTIDMKYLDSVREVLQKSTIPQFEGTQTVNWTNVLRDYIKNFDDIAEDGGWKVIFGNDSDNEGEEDDEEDEDGDFGAELGSGSGSEFDGEDSSSDDLSEASEDDSDDGSEELGSDESEGMDSDEMENWAAADDKNTIQNEKKRKQDDSPPPKSKKSKSGKK